MSGGARGGLPRPSGVHARRLPGARQAPHGPGNHGAVRQPWALERRRPQRVRPNLRPHAGLPVTNDAE